MAGVRVARRVGDVQVRRRHFDVSGRDVKLKRLTLGTRIHDGRGRHQVEDEDARMDLASSTEGEYTQVKIVRERESEDLVTVNLGVRVTMFKTQCTGCQN